MVRRDEWMEERVELVSEMEFSRVEWVSLSLVVKFEVDSSNFEVIEEDNRSIFELV
jgi:hypothetical protein